MVSAVWVGRWREDPDGRGTRGGGCFLNILGNEIWDEKDTNREGDGASDFDGFCWMGGQNNQPKSSPIVGVYYGETVRRVVMIGEDAVASFWP